MDPQIYRRELTHGRYSTENIIVNRAFLLSCHFAQYCRQHPLVVFLIRAISGRHVYLRSHVHYECATGPIPRGIAAAARRYCSASSIMGRDQSAVSCWSFKRSRYSLVYFGSAAISAAADTSAHFVHQIVTNPRPRHCNYRNSRYPQGFRDFEGSGTALADTI